MPRLRHWLGKVNIANAKPHNRIHNYMTTKTPNRFNLRGALVSLPVLLPLLAFAACPLCYYSHSGTHCSSTGTCLGATKTTYTPEFSMCYSTGSAYECFNSSSSTLVHVQNSKARMFTDNNPCPNGCAWVPDSDLWVEITECWNDDTTCGGNG